MSASSKCNFSNFKRALIVYYPNNMTTCDNLNHFINIDKICFWLSFPFNNNHFFYMNHLTIRMCIILHKYVFLVCFCYLFYILIHFYLLTVSVIFSQSYLIRIQNQTRNSVLPDARNLHHDFNQNKNYFGAFHYSCEFNEL